MNSSQLKILAVVAMVLDHIAWVLFPNMKIFNFIGRIAFPIFCFMIAEGYLKTRSKKNYLLRLIGIAVISEIPFLMTFRLAFGTSLFALNTIFDLVLGLIAIYAYDKCKFKGKFIIVAILAILALLFKIDGDYTGILYIYIFYKYHDNFKKQTNRYIILTLVCNLAMIPIGIILGLINGISMSQIIQGFTSSEYLKELLSILIETVGVLMAIIPLKLYNGKKGRNVKLLFYSFYPVHLIIIYIIKVYLF